MKPTKDQIAIAVEAIVGEEATSTSGYYGASWQIDSEHAPTIAAAAIEAVLTDIEKRIEALGHDASCRVYDSSWTYRKEPCSCTRGKALGILRGES